MAGSSTLSAPEPVTGAASRESAPSDAPKPAERRRFPRLSRHDLTRLDKIKLKYGPILSLLDMSANGAQFELPDATLRPGATKQ